MWHLQPEMELRESYNRICQILVRAGMRPPPFPHDSYTPSTNNGFQIKRYPSLYVPVANRYELTRDLLRMCEGERIQATVTSISKANDGNLLVAIGEHDRSEALITRAVILATGRFGPMSCVVNLPHVATYRRVEVGIRLEQPAEKFFLRDDGCIDPKYIWTDQSRHVAWRTFCCCRQGEVLTTKFRDWTTLSGRADCPPTGRSNVGFNLRLSDGPDGHDTWRHLTSITQGSGLVVKEPLQVCLQPTASRLQDLFGPSAAMMMREGLSRLVDRFGPMSFSEAMVYGPTIEGVGLYPAVNSSLRLSPHPIWLPGDTSGVFRGLTAALVSGYFVGRQVSLYFRS